VFAPAGVRPQSTSPLGQGPHQLSARRQQAGCFPWPPLGPVRAAAGTRVAGLPGTLIHRAWRGGTEKVPAVPNVGPGEVESGSVHDTNAEAMGERRGQAGSRTGKRETETLPRDRILHTHTHTHTHKV
jgi:hypothetical protein